jgi:lincosamide nucleotidyltransferase A/C/D/E
MYAMPSEVALKLITALEAGGVTACVGGGWAVDALLGQQTRPHSDLDLWLPATDLEQLFGTFASHGIDRIHPWPGDRPWNFVLHDGSSRRVDLHLYEPIDGGRLHYGSVIDPFVLGERDLSGRGAIAGVEVRCEHSEFAVQCHAGYEPRETDRHDVPLLCERFGIQPPEDYR